VVSRHQTTQQYGAILPIELTTDKIRNSKAYKEYYACATGEATPKQKASARKKKGDSASSTTPSTPTPTTTVESAPRLSTTAKDVQEIYMQEFWVTAIVHHHSIRFKMNNKKHIINLEIFRDMLHVCPRVPGQSFDELPFEAKILEFLSHNKCLTGKSSGFDSFRLSQAQLLWGLYHSRNIDYAFLIWEDFVYHIEHKKQKKGIEMYYLRFMKVVIHHFMSKDLSIPRRNKINWHYVRDDNIFSTIKVHQNQKASARKKRGDFDTSLTPPIATPTPITTAALVPRLSVAAKGKQPAKAKKEEISWNSSDDEDVDAQDEGNKNDESDDGSDDGNDDDNDETVKDGSERDDDDDDNDDEEEIAKNDDEDIESSRGGEKVTKSEGESDEEKTRKEEEESFDLIPRTPEERVESIFTTASSPMVSLQTPTPIMTPSTISTITTSSDAPIPPTTIPSIILKNLSTFDSVFRFDERLKSLEITFSEYRQTNPFVDVVSAIPENDEFLRNIDENIKKIIKGQVKSEVKEKVSRILSRIEESVNATLEADVLTRSSHSSRNSYAVAADLSEMELKKILIEKIEGNNEDERMMIRKDPPLDQTGGLKDEEKEGSMHQLALHLKQLPGVQADLPHGLNLDNCLPVSLLLQRNLCRLPVRWRNPHIQCLKQISILARKTDARSSFNELLDNPIDFSNFIMNRLDVDTLTPELLAGPIYELMRGLCNSLTELEYHLEEVYKATTDQLDWVNPKGQQYPHNLLQPLPLIPDNRGRRVIPFKHFINNDLEYLRGGASSRKYTTSVTKIKAADYGHIKWIEYLVPRAMWIHELINYDRHALWGVSHWGRKHQQFYGFVVNRESALDVYSKRRIITVTKLKIMEWHNYKHLDWILRREAYTAYSNPRGFIYQNKDKKNRLMRIDELHKFSDGTLNDVRNALDDCLNGIRMQYFLTTIWRRGDKDRAAAMI
nr:hypothetical protein [Tanacetum cinerariifolium]